MIDKYGTRWTREETTLALYLYCQIPFARTKRTTPEVIKLAAQIGRTPSSVARKLGNLGSFDERLEEQGISGLAHSSNLDRDVWDEYVGNWDALVRDAEALHEGTEGAVERQVDNVAGFEVPRGPSEREASVLVRRGQAFFRRSVLASYGSCCSFCGLEISELLNASHIIPWSERADLRLDPRNGLALCAIHDRAYDRGFITLTPEFRISVSQRLHASKSSAAQEMLLSFDQMDARLPSRFAPLPDFLDWHRRYVFS